ncbi:ABC transporter permease subunit [Ferrimonas gelatinilytica]|uniref:ABC transporter permease subunit n=1 Tax=Ferrimonas gelatinilytica TaxID=1255257 RepID=A0ABP9RSX1_9GAMM
MDAAKLERYRSSQRRLLKNRLTRIGIVLGGSMVLVSLLLIFFYLLYVVTPLFRSPSLTESYQAPFLSPAKTLKLGLDDSRQYGYRFTDLGVVEFYQANGEHTARRLDLPEGAQITASAKAHPASEILAMGLSNGDLLLARTDFITTYPNNLRTITPALGYPLGSPTYPLGEEAIRSLSVAADQEQVTLVWRGDQGPYQLTRLYGERDFLSDEVVWTPVSVELPELNNVQSLQLSPDQRQLFVLTDNRIQVWQIGALDAVRLDQVLDAAEPEARITELALLAGESSLLVVNDNGVVSQWFQARIDGQRRYQRVRAFVHDGPVTAIASEHYRKGFALGDAEGGLDLYHTTAERHLLHQDGGNGAVRHLAFAPAGNGLILESGEGVTLFTLDNPHPEISFSALWQKVWYEGYSEPDYVWQSTSGSNDFEAKMSLMPLAFGTLKAALYAMVFAVPLAVAGAIYTAYFMTPGVRRLVKPTVEIMEALPTVILGFLAGLWLAPIVERNLAGILLLVLLLPLVILLCAWGWQRLPERWHSSTWGHYRELLLLPVLILTGVVALWLSPYLELLLMGGDARAFITHELGIPFDQRNALVVGLAMGFAVIPTIFSIAEDAIFSVPKHLVNGSLALGATQWQTLNRVVLLTASPGIFSAIMMGFGRALGETMIVLMATGNTPLMEWNIFEGMRTLAANIAVEMPESAIGSSHYRVLFLAAFVLFVASFFFNTLAELVRQRLRRKYSTL